MGQVEPTPEPAPENPVPPDGDNEDPAGLIPSLFQLMIDCEVRVKIKSTLLLNLKTCNTIISCRT